MNEPDKKQRQFDAFRRVVMPILGVGEAIATQGKSPGTTALAVEQNYQNAEDRQQQFRRQAEEDALRRKVTGVQLESAEREKEQYGLEKGRKEEWEAGVDRLPDLSEIERLALRGAGPQEGIRYLIEKGKPDLARDLLAARLASQEKQTGERIESSKEIAGKRIASGETGKEEKNMGDFDVKIRKDPVILQNGKILSAARDLEKMLASDNPIASDVFGTKMAKLSGEVGNLAIQEQQQYKGSQALIARFSQKLEKMKSGQLTPENKRYALDLVKMYKETAQSVQNERINSIMEGHAYQTGGTVESLMPIAKAYGYTAGGEPSGEPSGGQTPTAPEFDEAKRKRLEELRAKRAAGTLR